jgi:hypothetical protein
LLALKGFAGANHATGSNRDSIDGCHDAPRELDVS